MTSGSAPVLKSAMTRDFQTLSALAESLVTLLPVSVSHSSMMVENSSAARIVPSELRHSFQRNLAAVIAAGAAASRQKRQTKGSTSNRAVTRLIMVTSPPSENGCFPKYRISVISIPALMLGYTKPSVQTHPAIFVSRYHPPAEPRAKRPGPPFQRIAPGHIFRHSLF